MFYDNFIDLKNYKNIDKALNSYKNLNTEEDNEILTINDCKMCYNFDLSKGVLSDGVGINEPVFKYNLQMYRMFKTINFETTYHIEACWYFPCWDTFHKEFTPMIVTYCSNEKFYYNLIHHPSKDMNEIIGFTCKEVPLVINCKVNDMDTMVFVSKSDGMFTWNIVDGINKIDNPPNITSMCIGYDRMFVTIDGEKRSVLYSENLNPINFSSEGDGSGVIEINDEFGQSNKVVSFKNSVYVFRDYNIAKINSFGDNEYFSPMQLYVSNGKIHAGTICACGNKIIYLASDGLHEFDGNKSSKIELNIDNLFDGVDNDLAVSGYSNGYYYLSCRMNFNDGVVERDESKSYYNNAFIRYNTENGEFSILRGYDIRQITVVPDNIDTYVLVIFSDDIGRLDVGAIDMTGKVYNKPTKKVWRSSVIDFGLPTTDKLLKEISFESETPGLLEIEYDNNKKTYSFDSNNKIQKIKPRLRGKKFVISFIVEESGSRISRPIFKVGVIC